MGYWDQGDESPRWPMIVAGAVAGALVVGLIWFVQAWTTEGPDDSPPTGASDAVGSRETGSRETESESLPTRLARCQEVFAAQTAPLQAAETSLAQWSVHVGAMNQLVTGAITLKQANEFWNETRISAAELLADYSAAVEEYGKRTARCPLTRPGTVTDAEAQCAKTVAARGKAIFEASVSDVTWREHVHHMEMLRMGEMSPDEATELWLSYWQRGARELRAYRAAAGAAEGQTC